MTSFIDTAANETFTGSNNSRDSVDYQNARGPVQVNLALGTATGSGTDTLISIEQVSGSNYNDTLIGDAQPNDLWGNGGNDFLAGGGDNDYLYGGTGNDIIDGGPGIDTAFFGYGSTGVNVNLSTGTATGGDGVDTLSNIENVMGSSYADTLIGDALPNNLEGVNGNDSLNGGGGNDTLIGGPGNDTLDGGEGIDTASFFGYGFTGVNVNLSTGTATGGDGVDTLSNIENVMGSSYADTLIGDALPNNLQGGNGNDSLNGGGGSDTLIGGTGDDTLIGGTGDNMLDGGDGVDLAIFEFNSFGLIVNLSDGTAFSRDSYDRLISIEGVLGGDNADLIIGNTAANLLGGRKGNDTLTGGAGADSFAVDAYSLYDSNNNTTYTDTITDFQAGVGGDILISFTDGLSNYTSAANPFVSGHARLTQSGADTLLEIDTDGPTASMPFRTAAILQNVSKSSLVAANLSGFDPNSTAAPAPAPAPTTTAKLYLGSNDHFVAGSNSITAFGSNGVDTVTLSAGVTNLTLDQGIERVILPAASNTYTFKQTGNQINVYDAAGSSLLLTVPLQGDADGTVLTFSNGTASALLQAGGVMRMGGATVSNTTPTAITPTLGANPAAPSANSTAKAYLDPNGALAVASSGLTIYGASGSETVTVNAGVSGIVLDQGIERVNFPSAGGNYTFKQTGNQINVYDQTGTTLLATAPVQGDADGTVLAFAGQTYSVLLQAGGVMKMGTATVSNTTPTAAFTSTGATVAIAAAGSTSAANGDFTFNVAMGNYVHTIAGFGAGDKIFGPQGVTPTVAGQTSFTDGNVTLQYAANGQVTQIVLSGLTNAQDGSLFGVVDFNVVFGAGTLA